MFAELFPDAVRTTPTIGRMTLVGLALSHNFLQRPASLPPASRPAILQRQRAATRGWQRAHLRLATG